MLTERHPTPDNHHEAPAFLLGIATSERTMSPAAIKSPCSANPDQRTRESLLHFVALIGRSEEGIGA
jgi:hypothetical protein